MKGLNIRKLAAVAVGGALVGSALAPLAAAIDVSKGDVVGASGNPVVTVVAGNGAAASDFVWAGNIAAKVAQLATVDTPVSGGTGTATPSDLSVDLAVGGSTSYSQEYAKTYDGSSYALSSVESAAPEFLQAAGSGQLPFLVNTTKSYRYGGSSYNITVSETVGIGADARFAKDPAVKDLVVYMDGVGDLNYVISMGDGVPCRSSATKTIKFTDGDSDNILVPFLGDEYTLQECDQISATKQIKLIKESAKANYNEGDTIPALLGKGTYAGEELSVKIAAVTQTGSTATYQARFDLVDAEGNVIDNKTISSGVYLNESFLDSSGAYALDTVVYVSGIYVEPTTSRGVVTMIVGKNVVTIASGKQYTYDSTDVDSTNDYWLADLDFNTAATSVGVETLKKITVKNNVQVWNSSNPLWSSDDSLTQAGKDNAAAGKDTAHFLQGNETGLGYDFVKVKFDGFKKDQDTTQIKVGDNKIVYKDSGGTLRTIPFWIKLATQPQSAVNPAEQAIVLDAPNNVTFYAKCYKPSSGVVSVNVYDANKLNGAAVRLTMLDTKFALQTDKGAIDINATSDSNVVTVDLNGVQFGVAGYLNSLARNDVNGVTLQADGNCMYSTTSFPTDMGTYSTMLAVNGTSSFSQIGTSGTNTYALYFDDDNSSGTPNKFPIEFYREGVLQDTYKYRQYYSSTAGSNPGDGYVYLLLDRSTAFSNTYSSADVNFVGTDVAEVGDKGLEGIKAVPEFYPYYWPDKTAFMNDGTDQAYKIGIFSVRGNSTTTSQSDFTIHMDTYTDKLFQFPNSNISNYSADVNYAPVNGQPSYELASRTDSTAVLHGGWTFFGTKAELTDDLTVATFTIPQAQLYLSLTLLGEGATTTVTGGETAEAVKEGQTVTIAGKDISVAKINYTAGTCTIADASYPAIQSVGPLVYTDSPAPAGNHIIVGGYLVNQLAENVVLGDGSTLQEALTAPGDTVAEVLSNGDIVVAGYSAADTRTAAQELIAALNDLI